MYMTANATNGFLHAENQWTNQKLTHPVSILILNLMPTRRDAEFQFLSGFNHLDSDVDITFMYPYTHHFKGTSREKIEADYVCWNQIADRYYDGLIITGSPVEKLPFKQVDYWDELQKIIKWGKTHVKQQLHECWAAQAGLYLDYGIQKRLLPNKLFGIFTAVSVDHDSPLARGFGAGGLLRMPQSRHTEIILDETNLPGDLKVIATAPQSGPMILSSNTYHTTYVTGHPEYQEKTLANEYYRDRYKNLPINPPVNYFSDPVSGTVNYSWKDASKKLYKNWTHLLVDKKVGISL
ncbi:homoserine O-acetyltransferase/O-succinyltransferase family protein [Lentilactobacillus hilgardii]|jgi:homoserine O-succinyltransferase|uniref:Homoserine O-acetyltransferase n=1 Tax=Lentilactobacillus hilgardii TaxID=1588 RepID=A0A6P1EAA2_LENHI|nr:homoserine O-succinyltransferase [Lentilactobacillus hilgardii]EEI70879.1 putative homoserine O-succinyltransferase [Lentilactobacillus hilgardii ATCC 27305]MCT3390436.1 homoserine O-succinyltransferase [Lentilactobacillus hilgardii]QHB52692.1 homoserine O-succinyltransferase [Lentilactobacillus hilgardii]RRG09327.1 MAG: homoserine O-succinyltransferase [Lactobacillus sp.]